MPRLSEADLARRRGGIGSSDVPILLGVSPHKRTPFGLWNEKTGLIAGTSDETEEQELGHDLEPLIAQWYERHTGAMLLPGGHYAHPSYHWAMATVDYRIQKRSALLEIKNVGAWMMRSWDDMSDDGVPHHVRVQCVWQAGIVGVESVDVAAMLGGMKRRIFTIHFDQEIMSLALEAASTFWETVKSGTPPELDGSGDARAYLDAKYPVKVKEILKLDSLAPDLIQEAREAVASLRNGKTLIESGERIKERANQQMIDVVGSYDGIECDEWRFTYAANKKGVRSARWHFRDDP